MTGVRELGLPQGNPLSLKKESARTLKGYGEIKKQTVSTLSTSGVLTLDTSSIDLNTLSVKLVYKGWSGDSSGGHTGIADELFYFVGRQSGSFSSYANHAEANVTRRFDFSVGSNSLQIYNYTGQTYDVVLTEYDFKYRVLLPRTILSQPSATSVTLENEIKELGNVRICVWKGKNTTDASGDYYFGMGNYSFSKYYPDASASNPYADVSVLAGYYFINYHQWAGCLIDQKTLRYRNSSLSQYDPTVTMFEILG